MTVRAKLRLLLLLSFPLMVNAAGDPCHFTHGYGYLPEQVIACYKKVPYRKETAERLAQNIKAIAQLSDLASVYKNSGAPLKIKADLLGMAHEIKHSTYANDYELQEDLKLKFKRFHNVHWNYLTPMCYHHLTPYIPLGFSSTMIDGQQIIYVHDDVVAPKLYRQVTGVNTHELVGQRLVSINGVDAVKFLSDYADKHIAYFPNSSNNFAEVLQRMGYSQPDPRRDPLPDDLNPEYLFEDLSGNQTKLHLPFVFVYSEYLKSDISPVYDDYPASTAEFVHQCEAPWSSVDYLVHAGRISPRGVLSKQPAGQFLGDKQLHNRAKSQRYWAAQSDNSRSVNDGFSDITPSKDDLKFRVIENNLLKADILYGVLGKDVMVLKVDSFAPENQSLFIATLHRAVKYACAHSKKIMIDLSSNVGGYSHLLQYFFGILDEDQNKQSQMKCRGLVPHDDNLYLSSFRALSQHTAPPYAKSYLCITFSEPGCFHLVSGPKMKAWAEVEHDFTEKRGGETIDLTDKFYISGFDLSLYNSIPRLGISKFTKHDIIIITDGTATSAGFFAQVFLRDKALIVAYGGLDQQEMNIGHAHGGPVQRYNIMSYAASLYRYMDYSYPGYIPADVMNLLNQVSLPPVTPGRSDFRFEYHGGYYDKLEQDHLIATKSYLPDLHVWIWDDSNKSAFYSQILRATAT